MMTLPRTARERYEAALYGLIALTLLIIVDAPKVLAYVPPVMGAAFFVWHRSAFGSFPAISRSAAIGAAGVLALATASLAWTIDMGRTAAQVGQLWAFLPPSVLLLSVVAAQRQGSPYLALVPWGFVAAALYMCVELYTGGAVAGFVQGQEMPYYQFNVPMVALALPAVAALSLAGGRWPVVVAALALVAAWLATESQTAQVAMVLAAVLWAVASFLPLDRAWFWRAGAGLIVAALVLQPLIVPLVYARWAADLQAVPWLASGSIGHHLEIWDYVARYIWGSPVWGRGVEVMRSITDFDSARQFLDSNVEIHPHSAFLQVWLELGAIGVAVVAAGLFALGEFLRRAYPSPAQWRVVLPTVVVGVTVPGVLAFGMWQSWLMGALVLSAALCVLACKERA